MDWVSLKQESKQASLMVEKDGKGKNLKPIIGINPTSLDKACLVLNTESDFGYKVCVVDNTSRNSEAVYWKEASLAGETETMPTTRPALTWMFASSS